MFELPLASGVKIVKGRLSRKLCKVEKRYGSMDTALNAAEPSTREVGQILKRLDHLDLITTNIDMGEEVAQQPASPTNPHATASTLGRASLTRGEQAEEPGAKGESARRSPPPKNVLPRKRELASLNPKKAAVNRF